MRDPDRARRCKQWRREVQAVERRCIRRSTGGEERERRTGGVGVSESLTQQVSYVKSEISFT